MPPILPPGPIGIAERVVLRKRHRRGPSFLGKVVGSRLPGRQVEVGERFLNYEVAFTVPAGPVEVTHDTVVEFID
ncbi:MAG TPA: hypothetical protein VMW49_05775, partial [Candidatus Dormibacteraeota bacterium]|nr:hypothetical protein [Candidatus Dormibacteraeota bacterium]